jgi:hypothetical protein
MTRIEGGDEGNGSENRAGRGDEGDWPTERKRTSTSSVALCGFIGDGFEAIRSCWLQSRNKEGSKLKYLHQFVRKQSFGMFCHFIPIYPLGQGSRH